MHEQMANFRNEQILFLNMSKINHLRVIKQAIIQSCIITSTLFTTSVVLGDLNC